MAIIQARLWSRRGTAAEWTSANPTLAAGEVGFETDTNRVKIGDGITPWNTLDYISGISPGEMSPFSVGGVLSATAYTMRLYVNEAQTITSVRASVGTAPTGSSIIIDVFKNGTTLFTGGTDRPTIAIGGFTDVGVPAVTSLAANDYLTVEIVQVGSTIAGADLVVQVVTEAA